MKQTLAAKQFILCARRMLRLRMQAAWRRWLRFCALIRQRNTVAVRVLNGWMQRQRATAFTHWRAFTLWRRFEQQIAAPLLQQRQLLIQTLHARARTAHDERSRRRALEREQDRQLAVQAAQRVDVSEIWAQLFAKPI
jgi:hypothetical protein